MSIILFPYPESSVIYGSFVSVREYRPEKSLPFLFLRIIIYLLLGSTFSFMEADLGRIYSDKERIFSELYTEYYESLCRYAYKITGDRQVAEDLVMDLFSVLWEKKEQSILSPTRPYLFSAIYHASLNWLRHTRTMKRYMADKQVEYMEEGLLLSPAAEEYLYLDELSGRVEKALGDLPGKCREIFELSRISGLKNREIAERLNISENTVERQMSIALKRLRIAIRGWMMTLF